MKTFLKMGLILSVLFCLSPLIFAQSPEFYIAAISPDGTMLAGVVNTNLFRIWDTQTGKILFDMKNQVTSPIPLPLSVAWSPDSKRIAAVGGDPVVRIWCSDVRSNSECTPGQLVTQLEKHESPLLSVAWSFDNRLIASGQIETYELYMWNMDNDEPLAQMMWGSAVQLAWHPTKNLFALANSAGVFILDGSLTPPSDVLAVRVGERLQALSAAWNSDGSRIAYGTEDGKVYVTDSAMKTPIRVLEGHTGKVYALTWNPNGIRLASSSDDGTIRIWNTETREVEIIPVDKKYVVTLQISWSADGSTLYYPDDSGGIAGLPKPSGTPTPTAPGYFIPPCPRICGTATATPR